MNTAIRVEDGFASIVLTCQNDFEKRMLGHMNREFSEKKISISVEERDTYYTSHGLETPQTASIVIQFFNPEPPTPSP